MNNHAKRCIKELESIGFRRDFDAKTKGYAYRHPNDPSQILKVFDAMTDNSLTMVIRKANKIADTGWSGPRKPQTVKERASIHREKRKSSRQREEEARAERAAAAEAAHEREEAVRAADRRRREIESLMNPGRGR